MALLFLGARTTYTHRTPNAISFPALSQHHVSPPQPYPHTCLSVLAAPHRTTTGRRSRRERQYIYPHRARTFTQPQPFQLRLSNTSCAASLHLPPVYTNPHTNLLVQKSLVHVPSSSDPSFTPPSFTASDRLTCQLMFTVRNVMPFPLTHTRNLQPRMDTLIDYRPRRAPADLLHGL
jgi:hypothetical protein